MVLLLHAVLLHDQAAVLDLPAQLRLLVGHVGTHDSLLLLCHMVGPFLPSCGVPSPQLAVHALFLFSAVSP